MIHLKQPQVRMGHSVLNLKMLLNPLDLLILIILKALKEVKVRKKPNIFKRLIRQRLNILLTLMKQSE